MVLLNDSFTVVILGDWNKLYIQPDWIAQHVFEKPEIEIGVSGQGVDFNVTYRGNGVVIAPTQSQIKMTAINTDEMTIDSISKCLNNFLSKATTPYIIAYGLNCEYVDDDGIGVFADTIDSMSDNAVIIDEGYEIIATKVNRTISKDGIILNIETSLEGNSVKIHFNEHHGEKRTDILTITAEQIKRFLKSSKELVAALGYEIEGD